MLLIEVNDRLLELNLSGAQRMNLHEHLEVEEGLADTELVSAAS